METGNVGSTSYSNASITQAFLPTRGMRFAGADDARVHDFVPGRGVTGLQGRAINTQIAQAAPQTSSTQPTTGGATYGSGTISGGALRPGAIDQTQFKAMLNAASAGVPGAPAGGSMLPGAPSAGLLPLSPNAALTAQTLQKGHTNSFSELGANAASGAGSGLQTLTPAQFAALTGGVNLPAGALPATDQAANSQAVLNQAALNQAGLQQAGVPLGGMPLQGMAPLPPNAILDADGTAAAPARQQATAPQVANVPAANPGGQQNAQSGLPQPPVPNDLTMSDSAIPPDSPEQQPAASIQGDGATGQSGSRGKVLTADDGTPFGTKDKNGVLVLSQIPDKDARKEYDAKGIKWRVADSPESDKLFFGPDGKFGWDDVLDIVNPLQHIPLINIAYRHFTGDEQNGSAELLGGVAFGPVSALAAIADLAVRSATGKDIGENVIAMVTGDDQPSGDPTLAQNTPSAGSAAGKQAASAVTRPVQRNQAVASVDTFITREHDNGRG